MAAFDDPRDPRHDRDRLGAVPPESYRSGDLPPAEPYRTVPVTPVATRRRSPMRLLLPLLLLLAVGFALTRFGRDARPEMATTDPMQTTIGAAGGEVVGGTTTGGTDGVGASSGLAGGAGAGAVQQFVTWANQGGNQALPQESEENHPYTAQGIRLLADALGAATNGRGGENAAAVARIRSQADQLQRSSDDDRHAEYAHAAFMDASRLLGQLHGGEAQATLTAAASRVMPDRPLSPQGEQVRAFFRQAATVMQQQGR
jgi:hypothetical protein